MDLHLKATGIAHTPAIDAYVEEKIGGLEKYLEHVATPHKAQVEIGKTTKHHKNGPVMSCHAHLRLPGEMLHAKAEATDLYAAIDVARADLQRQIVKYKEKRESAPGEEPATKEGGEEEEA